MPISRILLLLAAMVAVVSVGVVTLRSPKAPEAQTAEAANSGDMIAQLEAKVKSDPKNVEGWALLGLGFYQTGRFAESATAYQRAATLAPTIAEHWANYGEALVMASPSKFPADAKAAFTNALARDPKDVRARYFLAIEKDMSGDHRGALDDWIALLKDAPPGAAWEADVRNLIAQVSVANKISVAGRLPAARPAPSPDQARDVAALPTAQQNEMIAGMVDGLAKKLEANPKDVEGWTMLIRSYAALGRKGDTDKALQSAIAANPGSADAFRAASAPMK
jgi:cytochrome c-type biogenesis protein CcmH